MRGYLVPALNLPPSRVLLVDRLTPGAAIATEIERGVARSRITAVVLSPAYLADRWALGSMLAGDVARSSGCSRAASGRASDQRAPGRVAQCRR